MEAVLPRIKAERGCSPICYRAVHEQVGMLEYKRLQGETNLGETQADKLWKCSVPPLEIYRGYCGVQPCRSIYFQSADDRAYIHKGQRGSERKQQAMVYKTQGHK